MARTWTLDTTPTTAVNHTLPFASNIVTDGAGNAYFWTYGVSVGELKVWKWTGSGNATDISGTTFHQGGDAGGPLGMKVAWFDGELYYCYNKREFSSTLVSQGFVYKYSGSGQSWSLDYSLVDEDSNRAGFRPNSAIANNENHVLDNDDTRIAAVFYAIVGPATGESRMAAKVGSGGSWTIQTQPGGGDNTPLEVLLLGDTHQSDYSGGLLAQNEPSANTFRVIEHSGIGVAWANLSGSDIGARYLIGYADGKSFFAQSVSGSWEYRYSTDWGVNTTATVTLAVSTNDKLMVCFHNIGSDAIMMAEKDHGALQAYVWNSGTLTFDADGTTGTRIFGFFALGTTLYAFCEHSSSGSVRMYSGGSFTPYVPPATGTEFFYGTDTPVSRSNLPFDNLVPDNLIIRENGDAFLAANEADVEMVVSGLLSGPYDVWTNITGIVSQTDAIHALKTARF